jgi:hypothetical protein
MSEIRANRKKFTTACNEAVAALALTGRNFRFSQNKVNVLATPFLGAIRNSNLGRLSAAGFYILTCQNDSV